MTRDHFTIATVANNDGSFDVEWSVDDGEKYGAKFYGLSAAYRAADYHRAIEEYLLGDFTLHCRLVVVGSAGDPYKS